ncbi:MAG TPA: type I glutamate--ammonia ligase [Acidobacteriota bacterium]|nr:type I glutamate--ammonia ligase [Acidobacteriota bacterium]
MGSGRLIKLAKESSAEFIDLKFSDLSGSWHHVTLPISALDGGLLTDGVGVDGSSLPGYTKIERGDMLLLPDPETAFIDPFFERPTLALISDIMESGDAITPYSRNPRRVAADSVRYLSETVKGAQAILGPEFEFYVFDRVDFSQRPEHAFYRLNTSEAIWNAGVEEESLAYRIPYKRGYQVSPPMDRTYNLRSEISVLIASAGVRLKYHHHEVGGGGQHEIEIDFSPLLQAADQTFLVKYMIKNQCFRIGRSATFMPKPLFNEPGSGLHVHQYLADANGSLFFDSKGPGRLSQIGLHYVGGLLAHVEALLAFTNPSTNSFKRLVPGFEAPVAATYGTGNRTACVRIPGYQRDPKKMRVEFRPPDGTMNPYLSYAAMIMAGIDGIKRAIDPGQPLERNLEELSPEELSRMHRLPTSLNKALNALEADHEFLLQGGVFTPDLLESWIALKRKDVDEIRSRPTPYEFEMYYDS